MANEGHKPGLTLSEMANIIKMASHPNTSYQNGKPQCVKMMMILYNYHLQKMW